MHAPVAIDHLNDRVAEGWLALNGGEAASRISAIASANRETVVQRVLDRRRMCLIRPT
jgi:hypothetical protein